MKITILGTGTSTGVPIPGCMCSVCQSPDPKNKRLRCSLYIELDNGAQPFCLLIDTGPDLRQQALTYGFSKLDAVLYTHTHADHTFGIDDLRSFNFINKKSIPIYASSASRKILEHQFAYCFFPDPNYEGGAPPQLVLNSIEPFKPIRLAGVDIIPLPVNHGSLEILAFKIGSFAYVTDCSHIPDESRAYLEDLDVLVLDGLRERPHKTHFTITQAAIEAARLRAKRTFLTHISHELDHAETNLKLSQTASVPVELAFDGMTIVL